MSQRRAEIIETCFTVAPRVARADIVSSRGVAPHALRAQFYLQNKTNIKRWIADESGFHSIWTRQAADTSPRLRTAVDNFDSPTTGRGC